jgi:hypothetical protein
MCGVELPGESGCEGPRLTFVDRGGVRLAVNGTCRGEGWATTKYVNGTAIKRLRRSERELQRGVDKKVKASGSFSRLGDGTMSQG